MNAINLSNYKPRSGITEIERWDTINISMANTNNTFCSKAKYGPDRSILIAQRNSNISFDPNLFCANASIKFGANISTRLKNGDIVRVINKKGDAAEYKVSLILDNQYVLLLPDKMVKHLGWFNKAKLIWKILQAK